MQYRRFGRTNLAMPVFSCGGMRYQYQWQDTPWSQIPRDNQANLEATIRRALDLGINHIETARGYGTSELQLGQILPQLPREKLIIQTKVGPRPTAQEFRENFDRSFGYLGLDYIDLLGIHGINTLDHLDQTLRPGGCMALARQWQKDGKVRHIGFSTHGPLEVLLAAIATDEFDYINLHWYYINQNNWPAIEAARKHDMGVFIISPSDKGGMLYQPPEKLIKLCAPLSPMIFNDLFCLSHPQVHTLSLGAARPDDFEEHLKTLALLEQAPSLLPPILDRLEGAAIAALGADWYHTWNLGLPRHEETPSHINIPTILWLWNLVQAYDLVDYARMRYNLLGNGGHWFPGQNAAQVKEVELELKTCLQGNPQGDRILDILDQAHELLGSSPQKRLSQS
ncbi:aldo/keto reductase [Candidatus Synechococcus calcipolaris G9]|uniref:Aldo/keto reductase n=1 Tax=Candidatus Synechococcus calcipolaris G9 TaxID=1497997 RepID=A0ABT6EXN0_9SYNE|nr:aldo/keto reductase [Candidatus Synechococcus calcipolaris]MDG2990570.1 aldo/keto reductase [Candidatus Synechococcus calcipolaris G9]